MCSRRATGSGCRSKMDAHNNLPQIKSIWIDEDEEAEKLYGLQAQQMMDSDDEELLGVVTLNSEQPVLNNKTRIELPPLPPSAYELKKSQSAMDLLARKKQKWKQFFLGRREARGRMSISVPFAFQHISHADGRLYEEEAAAEAAVPAGGGFSKAFVTDALPPTASPLEDARARRSVSSLSGRSSRRTSRASASLSTARVVSTSTMATSVLELAARPPEKLGQLERAHLEGRIGRLPSESGSMDELQRYHFPTVREEPPAAFETPRVRGEDKFGWDTPDNARTLTEHMLEQLQGSPAVPATVGTPRRKSDSALTPILCMKETFTESQTPNERRSVDDVLLYYHQGSETDSTLTGPSNRFSFVGGSPKLPHPPAVHREGDAYM
ncbi:AAL047Cp [Eremothecium gossypii ATCC 10895]|uniref:AAL047Cp n=1 Tax=Eremothecium gossypii (strain ATCC 10895 / CBS 109.51 / FGSC 9923 / NRRL Y-1056) TaxID=284811 RepID=Q75EX5_EREGS|nr:AAL047Cp [Eremothecium gossypii ATCC 10895]AAS50319.1 AAL047Cp [Eremothecium gossypii ATCC 10895]AEY94605.1 FAAL047Cp [Eremothecium gossypii FDAG1]